MKAFASTLADLHYASQHASPHEFSAEAVRLLRKWIEFDGGVLGTGYAEGKMEDALGIADAHIYNRSPDILTDYPDVSASDPLTQSFMSGLCEPLLCSCPSYYAARNLAALEKYARRHDINELMLFGAPPQERLGARWFVAYRGDNRPFSGQDANYLHAFWLNLSIAMDANRSRLLEEIFPEQGDRAVALINWRGILIAADPLFQRLLQLEWPGHRQPRLPAPLWECAVTNAGYQGKRIEVRFSRQRGQLMCHAREALILPKLTPSESRVAALFSAGMSHKEVAQHLGVSQFTVRNHLKSSYSKLGLHDKAELARYMVAQAPAGLQAPYRETERAGG